MPAPMSPLSRRGLLTATGLLGAGALLRSAGPAAGADTTGGGLTRWLKSPLLFHSPDVAPFRDTMPVPQVIDSSDVTVTARNTMHRFHRDWDRVPSFAYGDETHLGPTLISHRDQPWRLRTRNELGAHPLAKDVDHSLHNVPHDFGTRPRTSTHLHGGVTPPEADGHPLDFVAPGEQLTYEFPVRQEATHLWYHDHSMATTRLNVAAGLAGMNLVRDEFDTGRPDNPLGLPAGDFEVPLVLQEKIFGPGGTLNIRSTWIVPEGKWEGGAVGDVGLVNGVVWPELPVARGLYRFRVINAGSFSVWRLFFSNRMRFWVIGNDGGLLDAPVATTALRLSPAERVDILVDFSGLRPGESVELRNDEKPPGQAAILGEVTMPLFCRFTATSARGFTGAVPARLRGGRNRPPALAPLTRPVRRRVLTVLQDTDVRLPPALMSLNNLGFTTTDIEKPAQGTTEIWELVNITPDPHAIHVHLVHARILERQALRSTAYQLANPRPLHGKRWTPDPDRFVTGTPTPPAAWEAGLKDTVLSDGNSVTRVLVHWPTAEELGFDPDLAFTPQGATARAELAGDGHAGHGTSSGSGSGAGTGETGPGGGATTADGKVRGYLWHCHMLDHEDHDMMLPLRVVAP
ncbi:multicopper oxidase domain-containing protein [Nocardioides sp. zg-ZUI104]|uniref:multicopper oxidase family protein n=1 Tax=Nocardioides faecalis TaxID=2803858 RepID=UPI001BCB87C1|nr:multicopper oxidase domain-containing protein [Nocardioides faecalis]MBS4752226.1 multicopper oxidase domain-containing protein [Nocardioides faecalis]